MNKSFCRFCYNSGAPKHVYKSHYTKNKETDEVLCPYILNSKCQYCHQIGHQKTHCPKLKNKMLNLERPKLIRNNYFVSDANIKLGKIFPEFDETTKLFNIPQEGLLHKPIKKLENWADYSDSDSE